MVTEVKWEHLPDFRATEIRRNNFVAHTGCYDASIQQWNSASITITTFWVAANFSSFNFHMSHSFDCQFPLCLCRWCLRLGLSYLCELMRRIRLLFEPNVRKKVFVTFRTFLSVNSMLKILSLVAHQPTHALMACHNIGIAKFELRERKACAENGRMAFSSSSLTNGRYRNLGRFSVVVAHITIRFLSCEVSPESVSWSTRSLVLVFSAGA